MNWLDCLGLYLALHLPALFILYVLWIQHERSETWKDRPGWRGAVAPYMKGCHFFGLLGYVPDVFANHTTFAVMFWRRPASDAWTFSQQLGNLVSDTDWRGALARPIAAALDWIAPSGKHITP